MKIILKGVDEIIGEESLKEKLQRTIETNKPLVVKLGLDPSAPDIHLGHTVVLRKMKQLQDLGHKVVIIIGDFTGKIGDPTGKAKGRKALTTEEVLKNAATYEKQIFKILDKDKTEVRFNSEWLSKLSFEETIKLASTMTVARMLEREDFKKRYENHVPISIHEFFYPLMQGYDSVAIKADIELGGTDQRFNVLMGRMLQKECGMEQQTTMFMPLLEGLDGKEKMSKSLGNYIGIDESAEVMYEKAMNIPDNLIIKYYNLVTDVHPDIVDKKEEELKSGARNPRDIKMDLAREITQLYHGKEESLKAEERFKQVFQRGQIPDDIEVIEISKDKVMSDKGADLVLANILVENKLVNSKNELRRLASQGGLKINNSKLLDLKEFKLQEKNIIQLGKKKFVEIDLF
ncbi:MAG TPA: tyrosine--tRNA ligase [Clostridium sp.]|nr:tyrosine--tRNA ligase [Clostridium sp.]